MSNTIDRRVVEMSFDNSNFEKNVSQSMSTLDKLKKALKLDGVGKGLEEIDKASKSIDLSRVADGVEALQRRFSVLGEIGHNALMKITTSVTGLATKMGSFVKEGIVSGGIKRAMNLEQANFMLQGLLKDTSAAKAILDDASKSVDGTAYSLDAAAKAAAMFAATGMRAGDKMYSALRGVAGVAAMTNAEYEQIALIFTQVSGQGRLMGDQLLQLSTRGINAAATLTQYMNKMGITSNATEADIRDMVSKGKISFELFAAAMDDAFGEHALKANETFQGAMSNIRAALARIGADFVAPLIKQNGVLVQLFNAIRIKVNELRKQTTPFAEQTTTALLGIIEKVKDLVEAFKVPDLTSGFKVLSNLAESISNIFVNLGTVTAPIKLAFRDVFPEGLPNLVLMFSEALKKLTASAKLNLGQMTALRSIFQVIFTLLKWGGTVISTGVNAAFKALAPLLSIVGTGVSKLTEFVSKNIAKVITWVDSLDLLTNGLDYLKTAFTAVTGFVKRWINEFKQIPAVRAVLDKLKLAFNEVAKVAKNAFGDMWDVFAKFFNKLKDIKNIKFDDVKNLFKGVKDSVVNNFGPIVTGIFNKFKEVLLSIRGAAKEGSNGIAGVFDWLKEKIKVAVDFISDLLGKFPIGQFVAFGFGAALLYFIKKIKDALQTLAGPINGISSVLSGVGKVLTEFAGIEKAFAHKVNAEAIFTIAKAIALLAVSMIALAQVPMDKLKTAGLAMIGLAGGITVLGFAMAGMNRLGGAGGLKGTGGTLLGLAAALAILVYALKQLDGLETDKLALDLEILGGMLIALLGAVGMLSKLENDTSKNSIAVLAMSASLKILVDALGKLAEIDAGKAASNIPSMIVLMGLTAALLLASSKADWGSAAALLGAAVAIRLMVSTVKAIGKLSAAEIAKGLVVISAFELLLFAIIGVSKLAGKEGKSAGQSFMAFAGAVILLTVAIKLIAGMSLADIEKGILVMAQMELLFAGVAIITRLAGENGKSAGVAMLAFSASMLILAGALHVISWIDPSGLDRAVLAIEKVGLVMMGILGMTHFASDCKSTMIIIAATIAVLSICIAGLSLIEPDRLEGASEALALLMAMFSLMIASTGLAKKANATVLIMTGVVAALAAILIAISELDPFKAIGNAEALSILMLAFSAAMVIISTAKTMSAGAIAGMYALSGVVAILAGVLAALDALNVEPSIETAASLSLLLLALSAVVIIFSKGNLGPSALSACATGALALLELIGIMGAGMIALGALFENVHGLEPMLDTGIRIMNKIGEGIGGFLGSFIKGFLDKASEGLIAVADNLTIFAAKIQVAMAMIGTIPDNSIENVGKLAQMMIILGGAQLVNAISSAMSWLMGGYSMADMGDALVEFVKAVQKVCFMLMLTPVDGEKVDAVVNIGKMFAALQEAMPRTGGILQEWMGEKLDLATFGENAASFVEAMSKVSMKLNLFPINGAGLESAAKAGELFAKLQEALPKTGGVLQEWMGEKMDLGTFGENISEFVGALGGVSMKLMITPINAAAVESAANAGKMMSDLQNSLPTVGGKLQEWFGGTMSLSEFGDNIEDFAISLGKFSRKLTENPINLGTVMIATFAGQMLSGLANGLPKETGTIEKWFSGGTMDMETFGTQLQSFGTSLKNFCTSVEGIKISDVTTAAKSMEYLSGMFDYLPDDESWFDGTMGIESFGTKLANFGTSFKTFNDNVSGVNAGNIYSIISQLKDLIDIFNDAGDMDSGSITSLATALEDLGKNGLKSFTDVFDNSGADIQAVVDRFLATFVNSFTMDPMALSVVFEPLIDNAVLTLTSAEAMFKTAAEQLMAAFNAGIAAGTIVASTAGLILCQSIVNAFSSNASTLGPNAGNALVNALISGITAMQSKAVSIMTPLVSLLLLTINAKQGEFNRAGVTLITQLNSGIASMQSRSVTTVNLLIAALLLAIAVSNTKFFTAGGELATQLANGVASKQDYARSQIGLLINVLVSGARAGYTQLYNAGGYLVDGLVNGVNQNAWKARNAALNLANQLSNTINNALQIHSPSRVGESQGENYDEGIAKGVRNNADAPVTEAKIMAAGVSDAVTKEMVGLYEAAYEIGKKMMFNITMGLTKNSVELTNALKVITDKIIPDLTEALGGIGNKITEKITEGIKASDDLGKIMSEKLDVLSEESEKTLVDLGVKVMEKINEGMSSAKDKIPELLTEILNKITPKILENIGKASTDLITERIIAGMGEAKGYTESMKKRLTEFFSDMDDPYFELGKQLMTKINEGMSSVKDELPKALTEIVESITTKVLESIGAATTESITQKILKGIEEYGGMSESLKEKFTGFFPELDEPYRELGVHLMELIDAGMMSAETKLPETLKEVVSEITGGVLKQIGEATVSTITEKIFKGVSEYEGFAANMKEKLTGFAPDLDEPMYNIGVQIISKITEGMKSQEDGLDTAIKDIIASSIPKVQESLKGLSESIVTELKTAMQAFDQFGTMMVSIMASSKETLLADMRGFGAEMLSAIEYGMAASDNTITVIILRGMQKDLEKIFDLSWGIGTGIVDNIAEAVGENTRNIEKSISDPLSAVTNDLLATFKTLGTNFVSGILSVPASAIKQSLEDVSYDMIDKFYIFGQAIVGNMANGMMDKEDTTVEVVVIMLATVVNRVRNHYTQFYQSGDYLMIGFANGIRGGTYRAVNAAIAAAQAVNDAFNRALEINSPSKKGIRSGGYWTAGIAIGIVGGIKRIANASEQLADTAQSTFTTAMNKVMESIDDSAEFRPTIRPVLDLNDVERDIGTIDTMFARNKVSALSASIERNKAGKNTENQNETESKEVKYEFTQNNYSPKALSRLEIYRQTKNLVTRVRV